MAGFKQADFLERRSAAAKAKKAALEKFRAAPGPGDPTFDQRGTTRQAVETARHARTEQRKIAKQEREVETAERAAREAQIAAEADRQAAEQASRDAAEQAQRDNALAVERKAARDARYAARKARRK